MLRQLAAVVVLPALAGAQKEAPKVVSLAPAHGAMVDASGVKELVVKFDRDMRRRSHSFCGGGPTFPKAQGVSWPDARTCVLKVALETDREYQMSLNCQSSTSFRSAKGVPLPSTPWHFSTLPAVLRPAKEQRARNEASLTSLEETLARHYSYYDHCGVDWQALREKHAATVLAARTDKEFMRSAARMLQPTGDLHLSFRLGDVAAGTGSRSVHPLYNARVLKNYLDAIAEGPKGVLAGKTEDGIQYLMISSFTGGVDFDAVEERLRALAGTKDVKGLVIDVRPNSGGDELLARRVARYFVAGTKVYAKNTFRTGKGPKGFSPVRERKLEGEPEARRIRVPTLVLQGPYCMSSCEAFLLMMKQGESVTLVGRPSYGSSGNPRRHELPNGVAVFVPCWKALRPDETCFEGEGIRPDVLVECKAEQFRSGDPILEHALARLRPQK